MEQKYDPIQYLIEDSSICYKYYQQCPAVNEQMTFYFVLKQVPTYQVKWRGYWLPSEILL